MWGSFITKTNNYNLIKTLNLKANIFSPFTLLPRAITLLGPGDLSLSTTLCGIQWVWRCDHPYGWICSPSQWAPGEEEGTLPVGTDHFLCITTCCFQKNTLWPHKYWNRNQFGRTQQIPSFQYSSSCLKTLNMIILVYVWYLVIYFLNPR